MSTFFLTDAKGTSSTVGPQGVVILTGDPKKAILSLSGPMIIAMLLMSSYNVVNAIWVVGLGSDALAAIGFISPIFRSSSSRLSHWRQ
jgi:Na+-driven multidrug efflux pump